MKHRIVMVVGVSLALVNACTTGYEDFEVAAASGTGTGGAGPASGTGAGPATSTSGSSGSGASTSSATASSSTTASVGGGGGATGGGGFGPEDCLDSLDNDGNGLVDCEDPACGADFECVEAVPSGWKGYVHVRTTPYPNASVLPCPDGSAPTTLRDTPAEQAQCSACTCGALGGATCTPPKLECWEGSSSCQGSPAFDLSGPVGCSNAPNVGSTASRSCRVTQGGAVEQPGSCQASAVDFPNKTSWANQDDVCVVSARGAGCGGTQVCVPKGSGDYAGPACIAKAAVDACPGDWPNLIAAWSGGTDDRGCTDCGCTPGGVACNGGKYTVYDGDDCDTDILPAHVDVTTNCENVSTLLDLATGSVERFAATASGGSCAATGGQPTGSVTPADPTTICCR